MKIEGVVSRGRSTQEIVLCKWMFAMYDTNTICDEMEKFCTISLDSTEQHVKAGDSKVKRNNTDVSKLVDRIVQRFFVNHQIGLLPWSALSPDLSPIENM
ncbi:uncharacterized protein TNCV_974291 [Trichonephila clavipes]|nr:uncharacterized protein TNCV_974291 [Trichonephila clavipes]